MDHGFVRLPLCIVKEMENWLSAAEAGEVLFALGRYMTDGEKPLLNPGEEGAFRFILDNQLSREGRA